MPRALLVLSVVLLLAGSLAAANAAFGASLEGELARLDVSAGAMAARYHPAGTPCARYPGALPSPVALRETSERLLALGLTADGLGPLFGQLYTLETRREASQHARSMADEYLAEFERSLASRPLARLAFPLQRAALREKLEDITSAPDLAASGAEAWATLTPAQQDGVLALLAERPAHFQVGAFVRVLEFARDAAEARAAAPTTGEPEAADVPPAAPCPPLPFTSSISAADYAALFDGPEETSVLREARVVPAFVEGRFEGFKVFGIRPGTRVARAGFCNGDRVLTINGDPLGSPMDVLERAPTWKQATRLEFALVREGAPGVLVLEVK